MGARIPLFGKGDAMRSREDLELVGFRHFAQGLRGRGGRRGGGGGTPTSSFFNMPAGPHVGSGALNTTDAVIGDNGGFTPPRSVDVGYGGRGFSMGASFWVRFNKQITAGISQQVYQVGRHNSASNMFHIQLFNNSSANDGALSVIWSRLDPYLAEGGVTWHSTQFPKLFLDYQGKVHVDKWIWISAWGGNYPGAIVLDEDDVTDENTAYNDAFDTGSSSTIIDTDTPGNWLAEIGTEIRSPTLDPGITSVPEMDFCNLRIGYANYRPNAGWWAGNYWKKQIDVDAERAQRAETVSEENAKKSICYGYPFQTDYKCQGGYGTDFTPYSGSIISGVGPRLIG